MEIQYVYTLEFFIEADNILQDFVLLGAYTTRKKADAAVKRYKLVNKDKIKLGEFYISEVELNKREWIEGFISI